MRTLKRMFWAGVGAAAAYLLDPVAGRGRRARLKDISAARLRDGWDYAAKRARYEAGRMKGTVHEMAGTEEIPVTDRDLLQKVRSEAVGTVPGPLDHVDVRVEDGVVHLIGTSQDPSREQELVDRIEEVDGVREIRNELVPT